ncbi:uncharacterized protein BKA55DRAFT_542863 [Fusarium redolens]|uniref:Uncharacterized protein n=1 Tax=Fusarium redolens TaxID=48865 RepID=A0A9P9GKD9_FUSRE|nr:uncharacterized protein BKA55DRAFT_542863 [Fusarium redolens]KAH7240278.1 hypothetical protein BKA55DRAFT_542863 [Fusarium redolens]
MSKVWTTIDEISSPDKLKSLELDNGKKFIRAGVSDKELEGAAKTLKKLVKTKNEISEGKSPVLVASQSTLKAPDRNWGALCYLWSKVEDGWNFFVTKVKEGWNFVIETVQHAAAAIQTIFEAISDGWEWIKQKLGFIFSWYDIISVKNVLVNVATRGILLAADSTQQLEEKAQAFFEKIQAGLGMLKQYQEKLPREIMDIPLSAKTNQERRLKSTNNEVQKQVQSPQGQYGIYHAKHRGAAVGPRKEGESTWDRLWKRLQDVVAKIQTLILQLGKNIFALLGKEDVTVGDLISQVGLDFAQDFIAFGSSLITGILGSLSDLFLELADKINAEINIPLLSPLYELLTGNELSVLDAVCLIIAIPTTLVYKTTTGSNPLDIKGVDAYTRTDELKRELVTRIARSKPQPMLEMLPIKAQKSQEGQKSSAFAQKASVFGISASQAVPDMKPPDRKSVVTARTDNRTMAVAVTRRPRKTINSKRAKMSSRRPKEGITGKILNVAVATGGHIWYNAVTFPPVFTPEGQVWFTLLSGAGKFAIWLTQFVQLADWDIEEGDETIAKKLKDDSIFVPRFVSWAFGGIAVLGRCWSKYAGNIGGVITTSGQVFCLVWVIIESIDVTGSYPPLLGVEEWLKVIGKFGTHVSGIEGGADPYNAGFSHALSSAGNIMFMTRAVNELKGRVSQYSGVDSD